MKPATEAKRSSRLWVLSPRALEPADVLLTTTSHPISWAIRTSHGSRVSHAALHVGGGFMIEAVGEGVRRIHSRRLVFESPEHVVVLRPVGVGDAGTLERVSRYAK